MSPRIFSQSRNRVFALNFRSRSATESPLARSFSARWLPMNPFPPVIRIFEILFHTLTSDAMCGTLRSCHELPSWVILGRLELCLKHLLEYFIIENFYFLQNCIDL